MMPFGKTFFAVLLGISLFFLSGVAAAPTHKGKKASPVTSSKDILPHLKPLRDNALFYSGPKETKYDGRAATCAYTHRLLVLAVAIEDKYMNIHKDDPGFLHYASEAMALAAIGKVYVLLPTGVTPETWYKNSYWAKSEWPALCNNLSVTHIIQLDGGQSPVDIAGVRNLKERCPRS